MVGGSGKRKTDKKQVLVVLGARDCVPWRMFVLPVPCYLLQPGEWINKSLLPPFRNQWLIPGEGGKGEPIAFLYVCGGANKIPKAKCGVYSGGLIRKLLGWVVDLVRGEALG